jgi:thioester reductase-like protein
MTEATTRMLLTGFPATFLGRRVLAKVLASEPHTHIVALVPERFREEADVAHAMLTPDDRDRVEIVEGDIGAMDCGLAGKDYLALARSIEVIHHCAVASSPGVHHKHAQRVNLTGTGEVVELARASEKLQRLVYWSSTLVSGDRRGRVYEAELERPERFRSVVEETRFRAEMLVREAMEQVPTVILRPSIMVGDSRTGEIDRLEGPYLLILVMLSTPSDLALPMPGRADARLNLVPIDYVVEAGYAISTDPRAIGRTFHLVDDEPLSVQRLFELIASATGHRGPRGYVPTTVATALLRAPGIERLSKVPRAFLEQLATDVVYDARNARELLADSGLVCPRPADYLPVMVQHVRKQLEERDEGRRRSDAPRDADDPLV